MKVGDIVRVKCPDLRCPCMEGRENMGWVTGVHPRSTRNDPCYYVTMLDGMEIVWSAAFLEFLEVIDEVETPKVG